MHKSVRDMLLYRGFGRLQLVKEAPIANLLLQLQPKSQKYGLIRIGSRNDGGYLIPNLPNLAQRVDIIFSPGVAKNSDFELHFALQGIKCYLADASVEGPNITHNNLIFLKKFIGLRRDSNFISMRSWIESSTIDFNSGILQMDIEGDEYENLLTLPSEYLQKFSILVIEFHSLYRLIQRDFFTLFECTLENILSNFEPVHLHPNNSGRISKIYNLQIPNVIEMTFLRKDLFFGDGSRCKIPNPLDAPNRLDLQDITIKLK